jgi:uncharacterized protein
VRGRERSSRDAAVTVHRLARDEARRIAVGAQLLDADRPSALVPMVVRLTFLQVDPTAAIAPSADLVAWSRMGASYEPEDLRRALEDDRTLFEHNAMVRPMSDLGLYLADMASLLGKTAVARDWLERNERFRRDVLELLGARGPLLSRDIPDTHVAPWPSSGWTNNRNVTQMLELLAMRGEVAIAARRGRQRLWDLAERVYPPDTPVVPIEEAHRIRNARRLRALGIAREKGPAMPHEPVLRASDPPSRPPGRKARRDRGPQGGRAPRPRRPPGHALHARHDRRHRCRDPVARGVAGTHGRAVTRAPASDPIAPDAARARGR